MKLQNRFLAGCATFAIALSLAPLPEAIAQSQEEQMELARQACVAEAERQTFTVNSVVSSTPIMNGGRMTGTQVVLNVGRQGGTADLRCTYNNASQTATLSSIPNQGGSSNPAPPNRPTPTQGTFQGRGVARGSAFTRGRNANLTLLIEGDNYSLELLEAGGSQSRNRARVQYRGTITRRRDADSRNPNSFSLEMRVRSFDSSTSLRVVTNTTGTCRLEVFDARVVTSNCRTAVSDSTTEFLGLEQF